MYADDNCLSCSDCKLELIEKRWTYLLLNWLNKCVHPKAPVNELNPWSMVEVLNKYRQEIRADEIEGPILFSDVEVFVRHKYPILRLRYYDVKEIAKKMYLMTSIILFHCCVSSVNGMVDGDICVNLTKPEQELILKFCENLTDMEVTRNNIELAIKEACDSIKQDPRCYRKINQGQKLSKMKTDPSESCEVHSIPEMPLSSINSMAIDTPPTEGTKHKFNALKSKSVESESCEPCSTSDLPLSSFNSMVADAAATEKKTTKFQSVEYESFESDALLGVPPFRSTMTAGKSPPGNMRQKITTTLKSVEYESFVPCSSSEKRSHNFKTISKSPTGSIRHNINTTYESIEYEAFVPCSTPRPSYNSKGLVKSPAGNKKPKLNARFRDKAMYKSYESCSSTEKPSYDSIVLDESPTGSFKLSLNAKSKDKAKYEYNESCSSAERPSYDSRVFDKSPTASLKLRLNAKSKAKDKHKSAESCSSPNRSNCSTKAVDKSPTESWKMKSDKSKAAKYKSHEQYTCSETPPVISIMTSGKSPRKHNSIQFKSSVTVMPSVVATDASYSDIDYMVNYSSKSDMEDKTPYMAASEGKVNVAHFVEKMPAVESDKLGSERRCLSNCACSRCSPSEQCCADPGSSMYNCNRNEGTKMESSSDVYYFQQSPNVEIRQAEEPKKEKTKRWPYNKFIKKIRFPYNKKVILITAAAVVVFITILTLLLVFLLRSKTSPITRLSVAAPKTEERLSAHQEARIFQPNSYICKQGLCQKIYGPTTEYVYSSLSRCILLCMGPQLWPIPIGYKYYSKKLVVLATNKLEYKFQSLPSEAVHMFLAEAFKLFLGELAKLERYTMDARRMNISRDLLIKKMYIQMDVETDPDPRIRQDTDESYTIKVETVTNQVVIRLLSASFCGIRHALETLSQLILLDQTTGNLITLSNMIIKDAPCYKYRGLMIDTGRNFIPVPDIMRTVDAMATVKLNTFHWRISDVTSFPLHLPAVPQLFEYGSYGRSQIYTKDDVKAVVRRAGIRGIRVLLEVAAPGPVGRAWSWIPEATCPTKNANLTCNNVLCLRLGITDTVFDILQIIYSEILEMTKVDDVFHLSDSVFSLINCYNIQEEKEGFLEKALERLKLANKGFLPKLPIIWYTTHLTKNLEARTWDRYGVQVPEWHPNPAEQFLSRFKVIHSSKWDLSCEMMKQRCKKYRTWQDMYAWKSWRTLEVFTIEGGEAILWTDLIDTGNLDYHLWPRTAAVAERLWSDIALNGTATSHVYVRLDNQRWRMLLKSVQVQPIWPLYCSFSPGVCLEKIKYK